MCARHPGYAYRVYGLTLRANLPIPPLLGAPPELAPDAEIVFAGDAPSSISPAVQTLIYPHETHQGGQGYRVNRLPDGGLRLFTRFGGEYFDFVIDAAGSSLRVAWSKETPLDDVIHFLLGIGLGGLLRARSITCLHGSALAVDRNAVLLLGPRGTGKSSTTTALLQEGCRILSDHMAPVKEVDGRFFVEHGYPRIRLLEDFVESMYGSSDHLPNIWPSRGKNSLNKHYFDLGSEFTTETLPIGVIYVLRNRSKEIAEPKITEFNGVEGVINLAANAYVGYMLDAAGRREEIARLERIVKSVPVRSVERPDGLETLPATVTAVLNDARAWSHQSSTDRAAGPKAVEVRR
jgi:hypothetical protein